MSTFATSGPSCRGDFCVDELRRRSLGRGKSSRGVPVSAGKQNASNTRNFQASFAKPAVKIAAFRTQAMDWLATI